MRSQSVGHNWASKHTHAYTHTHTHTHTHSRNLIQAAVNPKPCPPLGVLRCGWGPNMLNWAPSGSCLCLSKQSSGPSLASFCLWYGRDGGADRRMTNDACLSLVQASMTQTQVRKTHLQCCLLFTHMRLRFPSRKERKPVAWLFSVFPTRVAYTLEFKDIGIFIGFLNGPNHPFSGNSTPIFLCTSLSVLANSSYSPQTGSLEHIVFNRPSWPVQKRSRTKQDQGDTVWPFLGSSGIG